MEPVLIGMGMDAARNTPDACPAPTPAGSARIYDRRGICVDPEAWWRVHGMVRRICRRMYRKGYPMPDVVMALVQVAPGAAIDPDPAGPSPGPR